MNFKLPVLSKPALNGSRLISGLSKKPHYPFLIFTAFYLLFSLITYKNYGITFDEKVEYDAGRFLAKYYLAPMTEENFTDMMSNIPTSIETRHIPIFSVYSRIYPMTLALLNTKDYYEWYHLLNLGFGYFLFLSAYVLFFLVYKNGFKAVAAPIALFLTPYVLGHIPANPKDIPFATAYLIGLTAIYFFSKAKTDTKIKLLILGLVVGLAESLRVVGVTLLIINFLYELLYKRRGFWELLLENAIIFLISLVVWVISLPFLGSNLPANLLHLASNATSYQDWNGEIFYLGEYLKKTQRPWHYLFVLLLVKMPVLLLIFFGIGVYLFGRQIYKQRTKVTLRDIDVLLLGTILLNIIIYLVAKPVVYNGIRHFLYLVVLISLFAALYINDLFAQIKRNKLLIGVFTFYVVFTVVRMIILHPYEYIYFNEFIGGLQGAKNLFQMEYWGASYKEATEYVRNLCEKNNWQNVRVFSCDSRYEVVYYSEFKFSLASNPREADILICDTFRDDIRHFNQPVIHTIKREGVDINIIRAANPEFAP